MDDLDVFVGLGTRGTGKSNPMRSDRGSVNDPLNFDYDSIFRSTERNSYESSSFNKTSTFDNNRGAGGGGGGGDLPVYDKPVYDDDIFEGLPGLKSNKANVASSKETKFENDVFENVLGKSGNEFDDLLGNFSGNDKNNNGKSATAAKGFDDLLPGLGSGSSGSSASRPISESRWGSVPTAGTKQQPILDDPFMVFESSSTSGSAFGGTAPEDNISKYSKSKSVKVEASAGNAAVFDDLDPLSSIGKSRRAFSPQRKNAINDGSPPRSATSQPASTRESKENSSRRSESNISESVPVDIFQEPPLFDIPKVSTEFRKSSAQKAASPPHHETGTHVKSPAASGSANPFDDIWLTVSEIPLFTQITSAPPPSRPPPPVPRQTSRSDTSSYSSSSWKKSDESSSVPNSGLQYQSPKLGRPEAKAPPVSQFDELEEFAMGRSHNSYDGNANSCSSMDGDAFSAAAASAAAMKDAMDKAEAKFKHAKELREREYAKAARSKESVHLEKDDEPKQEKELRETQERLERERKQKEEEEREQMRIEREREIRLKEIERERARQAVERATREARERAAADARMRAERYAVEKANAEARERAERIAVQRAQAEARERAAAEARERAEKATAEARDRASAEKAAAEVRERVAEKVAAEAKEKESREKAAASKADAEARRRAERAVFERVAAEARDRAATEARERAAAATKMNQQKNDDDLESFFNMGRASSAPRSRSSATDPLFNSQFQNKGGFDAAKPPSSTGASSNMRKASSTTNFVDDLSSIFGVAAPSGEFQDVDGESEERRRARLERHQRTQERAAKALAEKNQRDLQAQREQEERHRISETLDAEIKRWAAGKEGNLRALLSTLQYVLWPQCGWQPVSLTDLITGASVKKVYRKATLCIHPDKVQQKGATLQQKYIAEKVFDLLKEAWNKFNSEELF